MTESAALLTVILPAVAAALGLPLGRRSRPLAQELAIFFAIGSAVAAIVEFISVTRGGAVDGISFLGAADIGPFTLQLDLRADQLSAAVAIAAGVVAACVQLYSTAYLAGEGTPAQPTRYPSFAAIVSMFTAAMMLVVHSGDLVLLLVGWEVMGLASYLLIGHHSERESARAAAMKAFLVTRVGDIGVLLAVVVLIASARTTSIDRLVRMAAGGEIDHGALTAAALLLLAGVAGKSAQFPLHTWLPDAMEGPTPISALIHAATMVAAGVFLVARLLPLFLAVPGALQVAAVIASISMVGAAVAAFAQDDLKRLLAYSTISQVAYMLGGVVVAQSAAEGAGPGVFHLLTHAAFKALLFLAAGCIIHLAGSTLMGDMGGLLRSHRNLAVLFGIGLAALAGVPPFGGFWSKEAVLTAASDAAESGSWAGWIVLLSGLGTSLVTGLYAGRVWSMVALGGPSRPPADGDAQTEEPHQTLAPGEDVVHPHPVPPAMMAPLYLLAVPAALLGLVLIRPPALLDGVHVDLITSVTGSMLALAGIGWSLSATRLGAADIADVLTERTRAFLRDGYRLDDAQRILVVRPVLALARAVHIGDWGVVDSYVRGTAVSARLGGQLLRRTQNGLATTYLAWLMLGAVAAGVAGLGLALS